MPPDLADDFAAGLLDDAPPHAVAFDCPARLAPSRGAVDLCPCDRLARGPQDVPAGDPDPAFTGVTPMLKSAAGYLPRANAVQRGAV